MGFRKKKTIFGEKKRHPLDRISFEWQSKTSRYRWYVVLQGWWGSLVLWASLNLILVLVQDHHLSSRNLIQRTWILLLLQGVFFNWASPDKVSKTGVSIIFKIWVFYKAWFERFKFFIVWSDAVFHKMQVVFYKSAHFMYLWSTNSVFANCDLQSSKILK